MAFKKFYKSDITRKMAGRPPPPTPSAGPTQQNLVNSTAYYQFLAQNPQFLQQGTQQLMSRVPQQHQNVMRNMSNTITPEIQQRILQARSLANPQYQPMAPPTQPAAPPVPQPEAPPPKPKNQVPKEEVEIVRMDSTTTKAMTRVSPVFWNFIEELSRKSDVRLTDDAKLALANGLNMRMRNLIQQSVRFSKKRTDTQPTSENATLDKVYTDVPIARFVLLDAEKRIASDSTNINPAQGKLPPAIEKLCNEAVSVLDAGQRRDEFAAIGNTHEPPAADAQLDCTCLIDQVPVLEKNPKITREDVRAALEIDACVSPIELQTRLSLQIQRIGNRR